MTTFPRPRLLDLFCGAGGAGMGYHRAGFDVDGVDVEPQPHYPFTFHQADALEFVAAHSHEYDAIHASPPCQPHVKGLASVNRSLGRTMRQADLIPATRELLHDSGVPWVIENVEGAPLINASRLCGSSFGLLVRRHRLFESSVLFLTPQCAHWRQREAKFWTSWRPDGEKRLARVVQVYGNAGDSSMWATAMGIDWMTRDELREAIPPAYTEYIGQQLLVALEVAA